MKEYLKTRTEDTPTIARPPQSEPLTIQERNPNKNYSNLSVKVSLNTLFEFERMAEERKMTPSALARQIIEESVSREKSEKRGKGQV